jgi:hypothetical protein
LFAQTGKKRNFADAMNRSDSANKEIRPSTSFEISARSFSANLNSHRMLEKAGFELEARLKKAIFKHGELMDELIYAKYHDRFLGK